MPRRVSPRVSQSKGRVSQGKPESCAVVWVQNQVKWRVRWDEFTSSVKSVEESPSPVTSQLRQFHQLVGWVKRVKSKVTQEKSLSKINAIPILCVMSEVLGVLGIYLFQLLQVKSRASLTTVISKPNLNFWNWSLLWVQVESDIQLWVEVRSNNPPQRGTGPWVVMYWAFKRVGM